MGSFANPLYDGLVPSNPTGVNMTIANPLEIRASGGANPYLMPNASSPMTLPGNANPYTAGFSTAGTSANDSGAVPSFPANGPGPTSLTSGGAVPNRYTNAAPGSIGVGATSLGGFDIMPPDQLSSLLHNLSKTYGPGVGDAIFNFLKSGAGFNQDAINNIFAALQPGINRGTESLMEQFSTSGNRFGSGAQIGLGDYLSQVQLNEGTIETQMYESAIQDYINTLMGVGSATSGRIANSPSIFDLIAGGMGLASTAAGGITAGLGAAGGAAGGGGALAGILAGLAAI